MIDIDDIISKEFGGFFMLQFYLSLIESSEDKEKFEKLYEHYKRLLKYVATSMLKDSHLAEDAVNETFIKVIDTMHSIGEIECHKTQFFLVTILKNVCRDMLRKSKRDKAVSIEDIEDIAYNSVDLLGNTELQYIFSAIASLPDTYRDIIQLKLYNDLADKDIAKIMCISNAAVRKRIQRGKEILRKKLAERGE